MQNEQKLIERLYNEGEEGTPVPLALHGEYADLLEVKTALDRRPLALPDAFAIDAITAAAKAASEVARPARRAADRGVLRAESVRRVVRWAAPALTLVIVVSAGLWLRPAQVNPGDQPVSVIVPTGGESLSQAIPAKRELPAWDEPERIHTIHARIETLQEQSTGLEWGEPAGVVPPAEAGSTEVSDVGDAD